MNVCVERLGSPDKTFTRIYIRICRKFWKLSMKDWICGTSKFLDVNLLRLEG